MSNAIAKARKLLGRSLTYAEKVLFAHFCDFNQSYQRGESFLLLKPDRVAMQDATAQMALLQFMTAGLKEVAVPTTVHCDHLIQARVGSQTDLNQAMSTNKEVYDFLESCSRKYGIGFWKPGAGIIHQVVLENYAMPGALMIGTDSHTPNAGGLGMIAVGVGGADAVDVMAGFPWEVKCPKLIGVRLIGKLNGWASPKDIILKLCGILTVKGGTDHIIEYFGDGARGISATGKGTITNMGAELGATTSIFPYDSKIADYLKITGRSAWAKIANQYAVDLCADSEVEKNPQKYFDQVVEIDLNTLEPYVVGPHTPDLARPISALAEDAKKNNYADSLRVGLIGSCTNSSYEDIGRAAHVAKQALDAGLKMKSKFMVTPGSDQIYATITRDGQLKTLEEVGGVVLANACGPCIGQWKREDIVSGQVNSIITSFNRNFKSRNDGNSETLAFIASPEIVTAMALAGSLSFNPLKDTLTAKDGKKIKLSAPEAPELPSQGFAKGEDGFMPPNVDNDISVLVNSTSERLQLLVPFSAWDHQDFMQLPLLLKAKGKCTTDHISPAGVWLKYRGHLDNISNNMFSGAVNSFTGQVGKGKDQIDGQTKELQQIARHYKGQGQGWIVVGDENYGEGSSREHAAMSPRLLGAKAILVKSFARIHETNLKKQGILPLIFINPKDYDKVQEDDRISIIGIKDLAPKKDLIMLLHHHDGAEEKISVKHTFNTEQIEWFKAGSALNVVKKKLKNDLT